MTTSDEREPLGMPKGFKGMRASLMKLAGSFSEKAMNATPFKGSWTAAQVMDHVTRSNNSITQALSMDGRRMDRKPDERTPELAKIFLDFSTKLKAPDFILPTKDVYDKSEVLDKLQASFDHLTGLVKQTDLSEAIEHIAFGEITKLELLFFVLYHSQRHTRQLQHIYEIVENRQYKLLSFLFMHPPSFF
jgi:hypothetical protein